MAPPTPPVPIHYASAWKAPVLMGELSLLESTIWGRVCFSKKINASTKMLFPPFLLVFIEGSKETIIILVPMQKI